MPYTETRDESETAAALDEAGRSLLFTAARTAKTWSDQPLGEARLREIAELAKWPPTMANTNPLRIVFVRSAEGKRRLLPLMDAGNREKTGAAPATAILAVDLDFHETIPELFPHRADLRETFESEPEERERLAVFNGALQAGYFILAVRAVGLAAGPMLGFDRSAVDAEFFGERPWRSILAVNLGLPGVAPWRERLPRLPYERYVFYA